jgi:glucose/arabinose dehydrogenase
MQQRRSGCDRFAFALALIAGCAASSAHAQLVGAERVASGLLRPVVVASPPGDARRLFIGEQHTGALRILDLVTDELQQSPFFLTIPDLARGEEQGLLGLAFHPQYADNGFLYVNLTRSDGSTVIRRYRVSDTDPDRAEAQGLDLLVIPQPASNHNGGWLGFGPSDGYLYIATGDGGQSNDSGPGHTEPGGNAQDLTGNLLGKLLRIDVNADAFPADPQRNYAIPPDNPFVGGTGDDEIWAYGLRNPFRCAFDLVTKALYCGDVGQGAREEIDYQPASSTGGENYGWRLREGTIPTPTGGVGGPAPAGALEPIFDYPHSGGSVSGSVVTGGVVYRGPAQVLRGLYFFADFSTARIWSFRFDGSDPSSFDGENVIDFTDWNAKEGFVPQQGSIGFVSTFGSDGAGNVYFTNLVAGELFVIGIDSDGDGLVDPLDRCPAFASSAQGDVDANGIGDVCECGDQNGDGYVDVLDLVAINRAISDPSLITPLCDTNFDDQCDFSDIAGANRKIFGRPAYCSRFPPLLLDALEAQAAQGKAEHQGPGLTPARSRAAPAPARERPRGRPRPRLRSGRPR